MWAAADLWEPSDLVFTTRRGRPLSGSSLTRDFQRRLAELSIPRVAFHDLRHSAATLLAARGVHPRVAMAILGHASITTTLDLYTHVPEELLRDAASRLETWWDSPSPPTGPQAAEADTGKGANPYLGPP